MTGIRRLTGRRRLNRLIVAAVAVTIEIVAFVIWRGSRRRPEADVQV